MRALFISDLHAALRLPLAKVKPGQIGSDRLDDVLSLLAQVSNYALKKSIDNIFILGDLFDQKHPDGATLVAVSRALGAMGRDGLTVHLLPGNHDAVDRDGRLYTLDLYGELRVPGIRVLQREVLELTPGLRIHTLPWLPEERALKHINATRASLDPHGRDILLFHQGVTGALGDSGWTCDDGIDGDAFAGFALALTGHFHKPQQHPWGLYLGSPLHLRFGDCDGSARGWWDIDLTAKNISPLLIESDYPEFGNDTVEIDIGDSIESLVDIAESAHGLSYLRLVITGPAAALDANKKTLREWQSNAQQFGLRALKLDLRPLKADGERLVTGAQLSLEGMARQYATAFCPNGQDPSVLSSLGAELVAAAEAK